MKIDDVAILCGLNLEKNGRYSLRDRDHDSLVFDLKRIFSFGIAKGNEADVLNCIWRLWVLILKKLY